MEAPEVKVTWTWPRELSWVGPEIENDASRVPIDVQTLLSHLMPPKPESAGRLP